MIERDVTIVLGAGASRPYGFPTGRELVSEAFLIKPEMRIEDEQRLATWGVDVDDYKEFRDALRGSLADSIDIFLETRQDYRDIGKKTIAGLLIPYENPSNIRIDMKGGWYDYLGRLMHAATPNAWKKNRLRLVTYNYDRSLEYALLSLLKSRYKLSAPKANGLMSSLRIVHVHGLLNPFAVDVNSQVGNASRIYSQIVAPSIVKEAAENIMILPEGEDDSPELDKARTFISESDEIVFLGFGYLRDNVRRLRLQDYLGEKAHVSGSVMGLTRQEVKYDVWPLFEDVANRCHLSAKPETENVDVLTFLRTNRNLFLT